MTVDVTEDEAALYDRQIRLWGFEAQSRMRTSHVLLYNLNGIGTEVIKDIVLSGIGTLSILDDGLIKQEDLGVGFFFRKEEVGQSRVGDPVIARIKALNPLVKVQPLKNLDILTEQNKLKEMGVVALVSLNGTKDQLVSLNHLCRNIEAKFYTAKASGFGGYIFSDLGSTHEYIRHINHAKEKKKVKFSSTFCSLEDSLDYVWPKGTKFKRLRISPDFFGAVAKLEGGSVDEAIEKRGVAIDNVFDDRQAWEETYKLDLGEFSPTCAILGGLLAQDLLNALGGREEPICNWLVLDSLATGSATVIKAGQVTHKM